MSAEDCERENGPAAGGGGMLAAVLDSTTDAVVIADAARRIRVFNDGAERMFGRSAAEALGREMEILVPAELRERHAAHVAAFAQETVGSRMMDERREVRGLRADGSSFPAEASITRFEHEGELLFAAVVRDVSRRREREDELRRALRENRRNGRRLVQLEKEARGARDEARRERERLWAAIEALPHAFALFDREDRLVTCNRPYKALYRQSAAALAPGARFEEVLRFGLAHGQYPEAEGREAEWLEARLRMRETADGSPLTQALPGGRTALAQDARTAAGDLVSFRVDITEIKRQQRRLGRYARELEAAKAEIERQALHDPLTGLANRRLLDARLEALSKEAPPGAQAALLHVDLDRFKHVNDTLGHAAGDHVLREVARILREETRAEDLVARVGGDEFVVLVRDARGRESLRSLGERLVERLSRPLTFEGRRCRIGASVGVACGPAAEVARDEILNHADLALYRAKRAGRGRVEFFTDDLRAQMRRTKRLAGDVLRALDRGEFEPHFQPQFEARTGRILGVEALARWRHPEHGLLEPAEFLRLAEELAVIDQLDRLILERSLEAARTLEAQGLGVPKLSVNVAFQKLSERDFAARLDALPRPRARLCFELVESIFLDESSDELGWILDALREREIDLELDDFGSGRASILALLRIRFARLKIDRQIVEPVVQAPARRRLVRSIVGIGRAVGIDVTAEGVATPQHAVLLGRLGCTGLQGHHLAPPMDLPTLTAFLEARHEAPAEAAGSV
ncbi:MAG: sensor domain-containing protein [Pseudomonadota bacterium]